MFDLLTMNPGVVSSKQAAALALVLGVPSMSIFHADVVRECPETAEDMNALTTYRELPDYCPDLCWKDSEERRLLL